MDTGSKVKPASNRFFARYAVIFLVIAVRCFAPGPMVVGAGYQPATDAAAVSAQLQTIATAGRLVDLRYPDFSDYRLHFQHAYEGSNFTPLWMRDGQPSAQASGVIQALEQSQRKGLDPEEYDASRWQARMAALQTSSGNANTVAIFDAALTVAAMRYISDLHIGRVSPAHFKFGIDIEQNKYDLPQFLTTKLINAPDVAAVLAEVEPPYDGYRRTEAALQQYEQLAAKGDGPTVPEVQKVVSAGDAYAGSAELAARLRLLGEAVSQLLWTEKDREVGCPWEKTTKGLSLPGFPAARRWPRSITCDFLHGKSHGVPRFPRPVRKSGIGLHQLRRTQADG